MGLKLCRVSQTSLSADEVKCRNLCLVVKHLGTVTMGTKLYKVEKSLSSSAADVLGTYAVLLEDGALSRMEIFALHLTSFAYRSI